MIPQSEYHQIDNAASQMQAPLNRKPSYGNNPARPTAYEFIGISMMMLKTTSPRDLRKTKKAPRDLLNTRKTPRDLWKTKQSVSVQCLLTSLSQTLGMYVLLDGQNLYLLMREVGAGLDACRWRRRRYMQGRIKVLTHLCVLWKTWKTISSRLL